jgi:hypothetical protein
LLGELNTYTLSSYINGLELQSMVTKLLEASQCICQTIFAITVLQKSECEVTETFFAKLFQLKCEQIIDYNLHIYIYERLLST